MRRFRVSRPVLDERHGRVVRPAFAAALPIIAFGWGL